MAENLELRSRRRLLPVSAGQLNPLIVLLTEVRKLTALLGIQKARRKVPPEKD